MKFVKYRKTTLNSAEWVTQESAAEFPVRFFFLPQTRPQNSLKDGQVLIQMAKFFFIFSDDHIPASKKNEDCD